MESIVKYESADGQEVSFTAQDVKDRLCQNIDDKELALVMALCQAQKLNPFTRDVYITKYGNNPAQIVTSKEVFTKRAQANPKFDGMEAGISVVNNGKLVRREGSMVLQGESLVGGWCKVYVKGYRVPMFNEVSFQEYAGRTKEGDLNYMWSSKGATMVRKVAVCQSLREAFPDDFAGLYGSEEMGAEELEAETQTTAPDAEKTASNDESNVVAVAEFVEIASDEQVKEYMSLAEDFADMCNKTTQEVYDAVAASTVMQGSDENYNAWTPEQMQNAINQINVWIEKTKEAQAVNEELLQDDLAEEDIPF